MVKPIADPKTTASGQPIVSAARLTKVFKDFWMRNQVRAVDMLDLEITSGQIFGLVGPNGSGKSTTIKMILGLLHKTSGRLAVFGKAPSDVAVKKRIGFLPEESYLYPYLNARETLDFYGKLFGLPRKIRTRRIDGLLEMVGLDAVQFRPVGQFSKGMQRRIGIAQALINDPEFLILDEPTSGLDPIGIRQVKDLIIQLGERGKTILLSSHLLTDVEDVCDQMTILYGGKKRAEGTTDDLLTTHERTVIETTALSDSHSDQLRAMIENEQGNEVLKIAPARQTLESLFLDIVEQARAEHLETHGAKAGGATAAFLRGEDEIKPKDEGDALLQKLTSPTVEMRPAKPQPRDDHSTADQPPDSSHQNVLDALTNAEATPPIASSASATQQNITPDTAELPVQPTDVDTSLLSSLTNDTGKSKSDTDGNPDPQERT